MVPPANAPASAVFAFGPRARRWAARLRTGVPVIVSEPGQAAAALSQALELRRSGARFFASLDFEDPRDDAIRTVSRERAQVVRSVDELRVTLDAFVVEELGGLRTRPDQLGALHALILLSHGVLVRSAEELVRLRDALGVVDREADVVVCVDDAVPVLVAEAATDVVVWAPHDTPAELGMFVTALQDLLLPVTIVAAEAAPLPGNVRIVDPAAGAAALARARLVIDATTNDPGTAVALARLGRPLAVTSSGGAATFVRGSLTYERWSRRSILSACASALGAPPPQVRSDLPLTPTLRLPERSAWTDAAPLVSIVIPTRNRPEMLGTTLRSIDAQTYPAIDVVIVNDAGSDIAAVVARHPRAQLHEAPEQGGPSRARNIGLRFARGEYVLFFDDDDEMLPEHVEALVEAAERARLDLAYGQMLTCYLIPAGPGRYVPDALHAHDALLDRADIQWGAGLAPPAVLFRRSLLDEIGPIDETLVGASDYEFWIRLSAVRDAVRVPYVTSIYNWRVDGSNTSGRSRGRFLAAHERIYAKHPTTRPLIRDGRREFLEGLAAQVAAENEGRT
jgi:GT2 family glycosyltransferase